MSKKQIALLILIIIVVVFVVDLLIGNYVSARLATTNWARQWGLFNPQAPIVVTNRETVRISTNNDLVETAENAKQRSAVVVYLDGLNMVTTASATNWTSDGYFLTTDEAISVPGRVYAVVTTTGDLFPVEAFYADPASKLVLLETSARNLTVFSPVDNRELRVGQQVVMLKNSVVANQTRFYTGFIKRLAEDVAGVVMESDQISRNLEITVLEPVPAGSPVITLGGRLIGVWDGRDVVMSDEIRELANHLLANEKTFVRPSFEFSYQLLTETEAKGIQTEIGARIIGVSANSPASRAGLRGSDIITEVDGRRVDAGFNLDNWLRQVRPNQAVSLTVYRAGTTLSFSLTAAQLP